MNQLKTVVLLGALSALLVAIGGSFGEGAMAVSLVLALAMNLGAYFFSDRLVLAMHRATPVSERELPRLHRMVEELAEHAGIPKPRLYRMPEAQPNAFATGRNPEHGVVAVTEGLLRLLDERELRGVLAHEIAHIKNRDILVATIAAAVGSAVTYLAHMLQWMAFFGGGRGNDDDGPSPLGAIAMAVAAPIAATVIQLAISRSREYLADETGARLAGDPEGLARALAKLQMGAERMPSDAAPATASLFIVSPFAGGQAIARWLSTHPPMEERIARLRAMTDVDGLSRNRQRR